MSGHLLLFVSACIGDIPASFYYVISSLPSLLLLPQEAGTYTGYTVA
jgi:hypothetical protein